MCEPATQHDGTHRGRLRESPEYRCCLCRLISAAYYTVNHRRLLCDVLEMTGNLHMTELIRTMLESQRYIVVLNGEKSRWQRQRNGLPQGNVLAPMLFNIYTNDQPIHPKHAVSSMQVTCALHLKEKTSTKSRQNSH